MNTLRERKTRQSGQIIILLALMLVGLLVLAAIATDGGMILTQRRYVQNAADASSLGGASAALNFMEARTGALRNVTYDTFICSSSMVQQAIQIAINEAVSRASANGFNGLDTNHSTTRHGVVVICNDQPYNKYLDIKVVLTSTIRTSFLQLIAREQLTTTNEAISRVFPRTNVGYGNSIISLREICGQNDGGIFIDGTSQITIENGGIHSNSCLEANGTVNVVVNDGGITLYNPSARLVGGASLTPAPVGNQPRIQVTLPEITCDNSVAQSVSISNGDTRILNPGNYSQIRMTGGNLTFRPGLYCMSGDLDITGGQAEGIGVTFYMQSGSIRITGGAQVVLQAPNEYDRDQSLNGLLIYMPPENHSEIIIVGTSSSRFSGTILAPESTIEIGGTSDVGSATQCPIDPVTGECQAVTFTVQAIGAFVKTHGNAPTDILYDESVLYSVAGKMSLLK